MSDDVKLLGRRLGVWVVGVSLALGAETARAQAAAAQLPGDILAQLQAQAQAQLQAQQAVRVAPNGQILIDGNFVSANATPTPTPAPAPEPGSADILQFLDGAVMHGVLQGMEPGRGLRWQHPDATKPFDLQPDHVDSLQFSHTQAMTNTPTCHFRFFCGDELYGSLVGMTETNLELSTWFGTTLKIPRSAVQTISFLPKSYSVVYDGPSEASGWVMGGQQGQRMIVRGGNMGNIIIQGGGLVIMNGVTYGAGGATGTTNWVYHGGSFVSSGVGTLARDFHLSGSSTIDFDLTSTGQVNLLMQIYASALDRIDFSSGALMIDFDNNPNASSRGRSPSIPNDLGNVLLPSLLKLGHAHLTIHCNKEDNSVTVLVDGEVAKRLTDVHFYDGAGGGLFFSSQTMDMMKLSNIKISQWAGNYEPVLAPATSTNADEVFFINQDKAGGTIASIGETRLNMTVGGNLLPIPLERVRQINFAPPNPAMGALAGSPWDVRAVFAGGGSVSFQLEKWEGSAVSGRSPLFGAVFFPPESIREMDFNLDRPKTAKAPTEKNEFDALDQ